MNKYVQKEIKIGEYDYKNTRHIMLCGDENYIKYCGITITSVLINNKNTHYYFHIICDQIKEIDIIKLQALSNKYLVNISIYILKCEEVNQLIKSVNKDTHISVATFFRIIGFSILSDKCKYVLYMDSDMFIMGKIEDFWQTKLPESIMAITVIDSAELEHKKDISVNRYFNAGIMFMDLQKWNKNDLTQKALENIIRFKYKFMDQDALNILLNRKSLYFDKKFNYLTHLDSLINNVKTPSKDNLFATDDLRIVHFVGAIKPWHSCALDFKIVKKYQDIKKESFWNDCKNLDITDFDTNKQKYKYARKEMKTSYKEGNIIKSILHLWRYIKYKLKNILID